MIGVQHGPFPGESLLSTKQRPASVCFGGHQFAALGRSSLEYVTADGCSHFQWTSVGKSRFPNDFLVMYVARDLPSWQYEAISYQVSECDGGIYQTVLALLPVSAASQNHLNDGLNADATLFAY